MKKIYTIGFTKKDARTFFTLLKKHHIELLIDVRLNNVSQLAAFTKKNDLEYFLELHGINYIHCPNLAPTEDILDAYKHKKMTWEQYERSYIMLINTRKESIEKELKDINLDNACLMCSEPTPENCHRRLAGEWLQSNGFIEKILHL